jgi:aspartyl-tRNA(Asn)/glutamyl-tRNA(Gln) amidotransferase subunit C
MALSKEEVLKVAKLARIELTEEQIEKFRAQLGAVLDYISQLQKVSTDRVEPTAQVTGLENVWGLDEIASCPEEERQQSLDQAPESVANLIKVKSVF